ncbi:transglutaminase TgpA family protein [Alkaliphilus hydrothermalis]|uniref:Transglutaminase-like putative cysteine protease n=1 Tax=Alkaliphilus hydrothermalis TaxID=1482730 RepID=A0ABS2NPB5_9FIRM|nr:transglutaminase domain-containing protein [Alkaliphilus hydrothermalis]MBM7614770.1 transglutaminase-like putative cysteine protease [Alkaliphilus hydrothermalis]
MKLTDERKPIAEKLIMLILIVFTLSNIWGLLLGIELNSFSRLIITALLAVGVHLLLSYPFITIITLTFTTIPMLILSNYKILGVTKVLLWLEQFIRNVVDYFNGTEQILSRNLIMFWVLITFSLCVITWFVLMKTKQAWILPVLYIPVFIYYWYIYVDVAYQMMIMFFILYFILIGSQQYVRIEKSSLNQKIHLKAGIYPNWIKTALAYGLIIVLLAAILPKGRNVVDWYWLRDQVISRYPAITDLRDDLVYGRSYGQAEIFSFSNTGFQESLELGGPVVLSDRLIMEIQSSYPFYLRGSVKSTYKNNRWEKEPTKVFNKGLNEEIPREVENGTIVELDISYVNMASFSIFTPYQPTRVYSERDGRFKYNKNYELTKISGIYKNEKYTVQAIIPNQIKHTDYNVQVNYSDGGDLVSYLQLPEELSPKITQLADEVTEGKYTPYEKAEAIRDYLRSNYSYTLEPSATPAGKEFVEYFLFEEKQGYCTYFATTMAVMLRTQGIPSRYIEGFRMPDERKNGLYEVRLDNAHAWVEAYLEPMGWITFEPTPAFAGPAVVSGSIETGGAQEEEQVRSPSSDAPTEGAMTGAEDMMEGMEGFGGTNYKASEVDPLAQFVDKMLALAPKITYILLLIGILLRATYIHFRNKSYYSKLMKDRSKSSIPSIYKNILDVLEAMGKPIKMGETPYEYTERIISKVYGNEHNLREITNIYIRMQYSREEGQKEEVEQMLNCLWFLERKLRVYWGFWKFSFKKYIKGEIIRPYNI